MSEKLLEGAQEQTVKNANSARTLLIVLMVTSVIYTLAVMSSIANLLVYDIPYGTEFKNAHSYWAVLAPLLGVLTAVIATTGMYRNMSYIARMIAFIWAIVMCVGLLGLFIVTMVDIFTCDGPDWWCFDPATGAVSWRYWWYAASIWLQFVALTIWTVVFYLFGRAIGKIERMMPAAYATRLVKGIGERALAAQQWVFGSGSTSAKSYQ
jgi:hypothetical protein